MNTQIETKEEPALETLSSHKKIEKNALVLLFVVNVLAKTVKNNTYVTAALCGNINMFFNPREAGSLNKRGRSQCV